MLLFEWNHLFLCSSEPSSADRVHSSRIHLISCTLIEVLQESLKNYRKHLQFWASKVMEYTTGVTK